jgi:ribosomal protein L9
MKWLNKLTSMMRKEELTEEELQALREKEEDQKNIALLVDRMSPIARRLEEIASKTSSLKGKKGTLYGLFSSRSHVTPIRTAHHNVTLDWRTFDKKIAKNNKYLRSIGHDLFDGQYKDPVNEHFQVIVGIDSETNQFRFRLWEYPQSYFDRDLHPKCHKDVLTSDPQEILQLIDEAVVTVASVYDGRLSENKMAKKLATKLGPSTLRRALKASQSPKKDRISPKF